MRYTSLCLLAVILTGCPTRARLQGSDGGGNSDAGAGDGDAGDVGGMGGTAGGDGGVASIRIVSPGSMTYANGDVVIDVQASGGTPMNVLLRRNDMDWVQIPPPFRHTWDTKSAPEGDYLLTATALIGGKAVTSGPVTVSVDRTPPQVTEVTPARGSTSVDPNDPIRLTFSEAVVPSTVTSASVELTVGGASIVSTVALAADARSLTVTVANRQAMTLPAAFSGTAATSITDRAGNPLAPLAPAWTWTVPAWVKLPPLPTHMPPRLAMGADRRPVVLHVALENVNANDVYDVRVARFENGAWNASMGAPTATRDTARNGYALALDSKAQPVVAWTESFAQSVVRVGAWTGSGWNTAYPALDAVNDVGRNGSSPSVRLDGSDRPVVAWREVTGVAPTHDIFVARWIGTDWTRMNGTGFAGGAGFTELFDGPQLALDGRGNPVFGWSSGGGRGSGVAIWNGTGWNLSQGLIGGFTPYPVLDAGGIPLVAAKSAELHVLKWGASWTELLPAPLTTSPSWNAPRLALAPDGSPVVAWVDTSSGVRLGVARWMGTAWDTRFDLFNAGQNPAATIVPELVVDARGNVWVAWMEGAAAQVWMSNY